MLGYLRSKNLQLGILAAVLGILSISFLLGAPQAVDLVESRVLARNEEWETPKYLGLVMEKKNNPEPVDANITPPTFSAAAVLAQDLESGRILYQKNIHKRLPPASTTKIMTALVAQEYFKPGDVLIVPSQALVSGSSMGLNVGESLSFRSLLYGMMLNSGNDAAYAIALSYPGGMDRFLAKMNQKAQELGLVNTRFQNPAGFDDPNHYSSAFDLTKIAALAIKSSQLSRIVSTKETSVMAWDKSKTHNLKNLNKLLGQDGVMGIKTGFTEQAGENLVGLTDRNGRKILTVVLNSGDRFEETKKLVEWVYANFSWQ